MSMGPNSRLGSVHWYEMYGLVVRSELELPEALTAIDPPKVVDDFVDIREGHTPRSLKGGKQLADWIDVAGDQCLYWFQNVCRMLITGGRTIVIDRFTGVSDADVRAFLFGSGIGTIVHQRRLVPVHISAVQSPFGTLAFTGDSGAGKSTIAASLAKYNGWSILCDDMAVLAPSDPEPLIHLGTRRNKLWQDAIDALELGDREKSRDFSRLDKYHMLLEQYVGRVAPPIAHLFELTWGDSISTSELPPSGRFALVLNTVYRPYLTPVFGDISVVNQTALKVSRRMQAYSLSRPRNLVDLKLVATAIRDRVSQNGALYSAPS